MSDELIVNGKCHCGRIEITANIKKADVRACHCTDCQKMSGAPLRAIVPAHFRNIKIRGNPNEYIKIGDSGNRRIQAFCGKCGTQLYASDMERTLFNLRTGFLEEKNKLEPQKHVYTKSALTWIRDLRKMDVIQTEK